MPTITGNVGGTSASGATVQIRNRNGSESYKVVADSNGDYTVTVNGSTVSPIRYFVTAQLTNKVYRNGAEVFVGISNVSGINLAFNALNDPSTYV